MPPPAISAVPATPISSPIAIRDDKGQSKRSFGGGGVQGAPEIRIGSENFHKMQFVREKVVLLRPR